MVLENVKVCGIEESFAGSKYPMKTDLSNVSSDITSTIEALAKTPSGSGHDQFMTGITVYFDLTFTVKAWVEAERYKFLNFISSQSTMHKIEKFDFETCYNEYVDPAIAKRMQELVEDYNNNPTEEKRLTLLYSNPQGFKLTAKMVTNYRALKTIYHQRKNHRLPEWREFCKLVEELPYSYLITGKEKE